MYCGRNCRCLNCKNGSPEPSSGSATPPAAAIAAVTAAAAAVGTTIMPEAQDMQQHDLHHQKNSLKAISLSFSSSEEKVSVKEEEETTVTKEKKTDIDPSAQDEDQLAIMAAVAMTELLTGNTTTTTATTTNPNKPSIRSSCTTTQNTATTTVVDAHHDETAKIDNSKTVNETSKSNDDGSINDKNVDKNRGSLPMKKRKKAGKHYRVSSLSAVAAISPESNGNVVFMDDTKKRAITTEAVEDNNAIITNELQEEQDTSKRPRQSKSVELESPVRKLDVSNTNSNNSGNNGSRNKEVSPITTTVKENNDDEMDTEQEQEKKPLSSSPNSYDYKEREAHFSASSHYGGAEDPTYHNSSMIESPYYSNSPPVSVYHQTKSHSCRPLMNEHQQQHQKYHHYHPQVSPSSSSSMTPTSMRYSSGVSSDATGAAYYSNQFQYAHPYPSPPVIMNRYYSSPSPTNHDHHHHHHLSLPPGLAAAAAAAPPPHIQQPYKDVMKGNGGLPKALSFRKICSKCGRTRGEHGERGFGNNCTFQDCGKCGASCAVHDECKTTMGILCNLTVEQGAIPGAADAYERKLRALAVRAEAQRNRAEERLVVAAAAAAAATQHPYHQHHRHQNMHEESTIPASKVAQSTSTPSVTAPISATSTAA